MISFQHLRKDYGAFTAVRDLTFDVGRGEVFGFLGPNGAGKTTTIRIMMGILVPSSGRVAIDGLREGEEDAVICRERRIERDVQQADLTLIENLRHA